MAQFSGVSRALRFACAALLCTLLSACFDFEQDLTIKGSGAGAGALEITLRMDPAFRGALETETIMGEQMAPVEVKREVKDGQYVQNERVTFNSLSELRLQSETLSIVNQGSTVFGIGPKKLSLTRKVENDGADPTSFSMMRTLFADRTYTFSVKVPGWIGKAYPLIVGAEQVAPKVSGSTVSWTIPMARAMSTRELIYRVDFLAYMDVEGNVTAERVPERMRGMEPQGFRN